MSRYFAATALLVLLSARSLAAQMDFYNTSAGRPLRIEDANPVEYRAVELNLTSLRLGLHRANARSWSLDPEATIGVLPRTHLQVALPLTYLDTPATSAKGLSGIEISAMHALNMETSIPALSVAATVSLPIGPLGGRGTYGTLKGIATRTLPWARFHANAQFTTGPGRPAAADGRDLSRWLAGLAIDKAFPLQSLLVMAESYAEDPLDGDATVAWNAAAGVRYQLSTRWAMDAGVGRRFTGDDRAWHVRLGTAYALGLP